LGWTRRAGLPDVSYGSISAYPVPAAMSGLTSSGRGPNCETDVMGHEPPPALQKRLGSRPDILPRPRLAAHNAAEEVMDATLGVHRGGAWRGGTVADCSPGAAAGIACNRVRPQRLNRCLGELCDRVPHGPQRKRLRRRPDANASGSSIWFCRKAIAVSDAGACCGCRCCGCRLRHHGERPIWFQRRRLRLNIAFFLITAGR
jgi:hypothetical protein